MFRLLLLVLAVQHGDAARASDNHHSLLQTFNKALATSTGAHDTPVARVVKLLKEIQATVEKEMEEDEALFRQLMCWCNNNEYEKDNAVSAAQAKISDLESSIESLTARSAELKSSIKQLEGEVADNKQSLAEATAIREKQQKEFHGGELDSIQAIENLKAALVILSKHHDGAFPQISVSLLSVRKDEPWTSEHEAALLTKSFDEFLTKNGYDETTKVSSQKFLQQEGTMAVDTPRSTGAGWSDSDVTVVRRALKAASAFAQAHHSESYYPSYSAQSGEIVGILKQLKEEMEGELSEAQQLESSRAASFAELRAAKTAEIESGEKQAEEKEDQLATTDNALAEAKEDLGQEQTSLSENQKFLMNLKATCGDADKNFNDRKEARMAEIKAVAEAITILTADDAKDAMTSTYNFMQISSTKVAEGEIRKRAAAKLRDIAKKMHNPQLSMLASSVELDAFTKVKKAIDDMIAMLKVQQSDEVKKTDWCKASLQENEMTTAKTENHKEDLQASIAELDSNIKALIDGIKDANSQIAQLQLDLQRASEDRKKENLDFQKTIADQTVTVEVLKTALDKLANYYDKEGFVQVHRMEQTPPVPQADYTPSKGARGVMEMIEKLVHEANGLMAESRRSESEAQLAYEQLVANTNGSVGTLQKEVVTKTAAKARATKDKLSTESDLFDTVRELEGLSKYNIQLHGECDYVLKNFGIRQESRAQEIEALQQAKQILNGATLA